MNGYSTRRRAGRLAAIIARLITVPLLVILIAVILEADAENTDTFGTNVLLALALVVFLVGLYEAVAWGLASLIRRTGLASAAAARLPRFPKRQRIPPGSGLGAREAFWLLVWYTAGMSAPWFVVGVLAAGEEPDVARLRLLEASPVALLAGILIAAATAAIVVRRFTRSLAPPERAAILGLRRCSLRWLLGGFAGGVALASAYVVTVAWLSPLPDVSSPGILTQMAETPGATRGAWALAGVVTAPLLEEFVFRGAMFEGLTRSWGMLWAAVITTVLFASMHVTETGLFWPALLTITGLGALAVYLRIRTGSIAPAVALHLAYNSIIVTLAYVA